MTDKYLKITYSCHFMSIALTVHLPIRIACSTYLHLLQAILYINLPYQFNKLLLTHLQNITCIKAIHQNIIYNCLVYFNTILHNQPSGF